MITIIVASGVMLFVVSAWMVIHFGRNARNGGSPPSDSRDVNIMNFVRVISLFVIRICDLISYGLVLLSFWICVLMVLASEAVFRSGFFSGLFLFIVLFLCTMLYCTFRSISLLSFYIFFDSRLIPTLFFILGGFKFRGLL